MSNLAITIALLARYMTIKEKKRRYITVRSVGFVKWAVARLAITAMAVGAVMQHHLRKIMYALKTVFTKIVPSV